MHMFIYYGGCMATKKLYQLQGVDCAVCASRIQAEVGKIDGIASSEIDILSKRLAVTVNQEHAESIDSSIVRTVERTDPQATAFPLDRKEPSPGTPNRWIIPVRILLTVSAAIFGVVLSSPLLFIIAYLTSGYDVIVRALKNIVHGQLFDEYFLMTIATIGACAIGEYGEAVAVMAFYQIGMYLEDKAVHRSRASIASLMDIKPQTATVLRDTKQLVVAPEDVAVGEIILIKPGERIPLDSRIVAGESDIDTKALTGESAPRHVGPADELVSGCLNLSGALHAMTTASYTDSTVAKILSLVEESALHKAQTERFITRFSRYYTPVVVAIALLVATVPPLVLPQAVFSDWLYRALVFLVISCPCALVLSVPLTFFAGIGGAARMGVLVKGGNYLQALAASHTVVFDKTGTLTEGSFTVHSLQVYEDAPFDTATILSYAAALESSSNHPIAKAIVDYGPSKRPAVDRVEETAGAGIRGYVEGHLIHIGTARFLKEQLGATCSRQDPYAIFVAIDRQVVASFTVSDSMKNDARDTVYALKKAGVQRIALLTGDNEKAARQIAEDTGISEVYSQLLPHDKVSYIQRFINEKPKGTSVVFVGDGINDAPSLALADVGIAMGALGSDAAIEAADIVVMHDDLTSIPRSIAHAKRTMRIVRQNISFALAAKTAILVLAVFGMASMWLAVFADTGVALLAIINALRALRLRH